MATWHWRTFQELTLEELYEILRLRQDVFILEQKCLYQDIDEQDQQAQHLLVLENGRLVVYLRMFPKGTLYPDAVSFGRLLITKSERNKGLAKDAMRRLITYLNDCKNQDPMIISAQTYLQQFYRSFGFLEVGSPYDEDGVPHIKMIKYFDRNNL